MAERARARYVPSRSELKYARKSLRGRATKHGTIVLGKVRTRPPKIPSAKSFVDNASKIFPINGKHMVLHYADICTYTTSGGAAYQLRLNSCNDIDLSQAGHQPMYFDQLCTANGPYATYQVDSATVKISIINDAGVGVWLAGGMWTQLTSPATGTLDNYRENGGPAVFIGCASSTGVSKGTITLKVPKICSKFGLKEDDDTLRAAYNANPASSLYCFFNVFDKTGAASAHVFPVILEVAQNVMFSNRVFAAQS